MSDAELIGYEQELSDELVAASNSSSGDMSVGIGFGSWGGGSGYGIGMDRWLGGSGDAAAASELRTRREAVRDEMRKRGLLSP